MAYQKYQIQLINYTLTPGVYAVSAITIGAQTAIAGAGVLGTCAVRQPIADVGGAVGGTGKTTAAPYVY